MTRRPRARAALALPAAVALLLTGCVDEPDAALTEETAASSPSPDATGPVATPDGPDSPDGPDAGAATAALPGLLGPGAAPGVTDWALEPCDVPAAAAPQEMVSNLDDDPGPGDGLVVREQVGAYGSVQEASVAVAALVQEMERCAGTEEGVSTSATSSGTGGRGLAVDQGQFTLRTEVTRSGAAVLLVQASGEVGTEVASGEAVARLARLVGGLAAA